MLLTLTTTYQPATDLGFLLVKHPDRLHSFDLPTGTAYVFYPEADEQRCTVALLLDVDPVRLSPARHRIEGREKGRGRERMPDGFTLGQYVNDRPYAASSLLATALSRVFRSALRGDSRDRPELAATPLPLEIRVPVLRCRGGAEVAGQLFGPLGWTVTATPVPLDDRHPEWGDSPYVDLTLTGTFRLSEALNHLYVLLPVLDDAKHYWVAPDEIDKLLRAGTGWLATHPGRGTIARRYLAHRRSLAGTALERLAELRLADEQPDLDSVDESDAPDSVDEVTDAADATDSVDESADVTEATEGTAATDSGSPVPVEPGGRPVDPAVERRKTLAEQRRTAVLAALARTGASRVLDLGCGEGALLAALIRDPRYTEIVGTDVSSMALTIAARRLRLDRMPPRQRERLTLWQSALTYRDDRLHGYDAAVLMEVVEHVDPPRLPALELAVFGHAQPGAVVVTTPNIEYNVRYEGLAAGRLRHPDHRFEWTRAEFADWVHRVAGTYGYRAEIHGVGDDDPQVGTPTQLAVLTREGTTP